MMTKMMVMIKKEGLQYSQQDWTLHKEFAILWQKILVLIDRHLFHSDNDCSTVVLYCKGLGGMGWDFISYFRWRGEN